MMKKLMGVNVMKKKILLFLGAILLILGFAKLSSVNADAATIKVTDWGAKKVFTTPKKTRTVSKNRY